MDNETLIIGLIVAAGLAFIPASIAKKKGYSFGLWWLYGWLLFIVAIVHAAIIPNKNESQLANPQTNSSTVFSVPTHSVADELKKYKELLDLGAITEKEFVAKKEQLLKLI